MTQARVIVAGANAGGGARAITLGRRSGEGSLSQFLLDPPGDSTALPVVGALQEVAVARPEIDVPTELTRDFGRRKAPYDVVYHPTVTSHCYPLKEKWGVRWELDEPDYTDPKGPDDIEQGMATCVHGPVRLTDPFDTSPAVGRRPFRKLVIDLPMVEFVKGGQFGVAPNRFRFAHYRGDRNTEPRAALAHRIRLPAVDETQYEPQCVLVNLHLTTLRGEDQTVKKAREVARKRRTPSPQGSELRGLQLSVVADFISEWAYERLQLPVIVVGDFNATPAVSEFVDFLRDASLRAVFVGGDTACWACGEPLRSSRRLFTSEDSAEVLTEDESSFKDITGMTPKPITVTEWCDMCKKPQFTHKRNFGLIDNIAYTDPDRKRTDWTVRPERWGLGFRTCFSDHVPTWAEFVVSG